MSHRVGATIDVQGVTVPTLLYGTAWKEERTASLVSEALRAGFRGIDTANQRRHYHEAGVGEAIAAWRSSAPRTAAPFIQTKFTHLESQDERLPYDPSADFPTRVRQSFASSLEHLGVDRIDSLLLHGPRSRTGWSGADLEVWRTLESLQRDGVVRLIGVSNVGRGQLEQLCHLAEVRPAFVQNRCFARMGWDREVRAICRAEGIVYQGFSLLTANGEELRASLLRGLADRLGRSVPQVVFRFALQLGMICLTGTTDPKHMREDLSVFDFELTVGEVEAIEKMTG